MRIFLTGLSGLFGLNAALTFLDRGQEVWGSYLTHPVELPSGRALQLDVRSQDEVLEALCEARPDFVIHAAAETSVDACQDSPGRARSANVEATAIMATCAQKIGAHFVLLSTDQLFDGVKRFCREEDDPAPLNMYGRTKLEAERMAERLAGGALIIRTNFFGWGPSYKPSLSDWMLGQLRARRVVSGFADVFFTPILVNHLLETIELLLLRHATGVFHVVGSDRISKYDFACLLADVTGADKDLVKPILLKDAQLRAPRPGEMSLDGRKVASFLNRPSPPIHRGLVDLLRLEREGWPCRVDAKQVSGKVETGLG